MLYEVITTNMFYRVLIQSGLDESLVDEEIEVGPEMQENLMKSGIFSSEEVRMKPTILEYCDAELIVPMVTEERIFGMLLMGPKRSERSYTLQDISLLSLLAKSYNFV